MAARLKLIIAYDGAPFAGWQSQRHGRTIQDQLEAAFHKITHSSLRVHGAGRTDAGVHALAQCAHVDLPDRTRPADRWRDALNGQLPATIRILRCQYVAENFHARYSARGKIYRYRIWNGPILPPLELNRAWHVRARLDLGQAARAARIFTGRHDFAGFAANRGHANEETIRTIRNVRAIKKGYLLTIEFDGDGFLYRMVRLMVGTIVQHGSGKVALSQIREQLRAPRVDRARLAAPAAGLLLVRVYY